MVELPWLSYDGDDFPDPQEALDDPNGLLALGGSLSTKRLINAYQNGIFPWYEDGEPIMWWSPDPRGVIIPSQVHISKSLNKTLRQNKFSTTFDKAFTDVMAQCAHARRQQKYPGTWITPDMIDAYSELHQMGIAHSVECWRQDHLVGGLYGITIGHVFCGESMFSIERDASKVALVALCEKLKKDGFKLVDCQMTNSHLVSLGCTEMSRSEYLHVLRDGVNKHLWAVYSGD